LKNHAIAKYDDQTGKRSLREFKPSQMPGEVYFVADPKGANEDDGWIFAYVSDLGTQLSELWILDATNIKATPTAVIELGVWVPQGVHGSWISDAELNLK
jgi:carotenoid cleavage dioxygenase